MDFFSRLIKFVTDKDFRFIALSNRGLYNNMDDSQYLIRMYNATQKKELDLNNPKTYNEKLQWLKIYDRKPIYSRMVDKYEAKRYIAEIIGNEYIIPTYGVWDRYEDINFEELPISFVLKTTHDSGTVAICYDKGKIDHNKMRKKFNKALKKNFFYYGREWPYKNVKPRIIAEKLLVSHTGSEIKDYKLHCINGKVRFLYVTSDRYNGKGLKADYFDDKFNRLDIQWELPNSNYTIEKPKNFELMKMIAEKISNNVIVLRVDFYEVDGALYVGELTFFDGSGFAKINKDWDKVLGEYIKLPEL